MLTERLNQFIRPMLKSRQKETVDCIGDVVTGASFINRLVRQLMRHSRKVMVIPLLPVGAKQLPLGCSEGAETVVQSERRKSS
jgi:hypothetical protein